MKTHSKLSNPPTRNPDKKHAAPIQILVITRTFFPKEGGIEEYVYNRCLQDPEQVTILTSSCTGDCLFDAQQPFTVYRWWLPSWLPNNRVGSLIKQIINMIGAFWMALILNARHEYDAIEWCHGYDFPALWALTYFVPTKFYMYLHGNDLLCPLRSPLIKYPFAFTLKRLNAVICNSSFTEQYFRSNFSLPIQTFIINPTVRTDKFNLETATIPQLPNVREKYGISPSAIIILSVGRLVKRKGFDRVICTLPKLREEGLDVHYILCGRGKLQSELAQLAAELDVDSYVHFAGFVPDKALADYYSACDIFALLTSFDEKAASIEGFGIVYVEAGYFGKPVLATEIGGVIDAVHHEKNGLLVEPDDSEGITQAFLRLCRDSSLRKKLGQTGRELAQHQTLHCSIYQV
jgi:glycosyltransferase involved in cell wall biosynthesis